MLHVASVETIINTMAVRANRNDQLGVSPLVSAQNRQAQTYDNRMCNVENVMDAAPYPCNGKLTNIPSTLISVSQNRRW